MEGTLCILVDVGEAPKGVGMSKTVPIMISRLWLGRPQLVRHLLSALLLHIAKAGTKASENVDVMQL